MFFKSSTRIIPGNFFFVCGLEIEMDRKLKTKTKTKNK